MESNSFRVWNKEKREFSEDVFYIDKKGRLFMNDGKNLEYRSTILNNATIYPASYKDNNGYGDRYEQKMVMYGSKGTPANVIVGWLYKADGSISMTSAYIREVSEWK